MPSFAAFSQTPRHIPLDEIEPGDIVVVGTGRKKVGDHITIADQNVGGLIYTYEGNAWGLGPGEPAETYEGVITRTRPLPKSAGGPGVGGDRCPVSGGRQTKEAMHAYRFLAEDYTPIEP